MSEVLRFGVSIEHGLLESFDELIAGRGYANRSEALRDLIRDALVKSRLEAPHGDAEVLGSLTLVYDHHAHDLTKQMARIQHDCHGLVVSVTHVHINHDDCLEVLVLRGRAREVRAPADSLLSLRGVKHGRLFTTLPSHAVAGRVATAHAHHRHPPRDEIARGAHGANKSTAE